MILSRFFSKSKPIVYLCLVGYISLVFWWNAIRLSHPLSWATLSKYFLLLFLFFGVNFIVKRNKINYKNTFAVFVFSMLVMAVPTSYLDYNLLIACIFLVLGLRRLISLKTQIEPKKKIFDAALWFFVASMFQPYLILMIILVFLGVLQYTLYDTKNLFIPILAWACGGIFFSTYMLLTTNEWHFFYENYTNFGWSNIDLIWHNNKMFLSICCLFTLFVLVKVYLISTKAQLTFKNSILIIFLTFILSLVGWLFSNQNELTGIAISFIPLSMLAGLSLEAKFKPIIKEIILWVLILVTFYSSFGLSSYQLSKVFSVL